MKLRKPNSTPVMPLIFMLCFGITGGDMKFLRARQKHIRSKPIILNSVITWPVSPDRLVASHVVPMLWRVPFAGSSFATTIARLSNAYIQIIPIISSTSFTYPFRHSPAFLFRRLLTRSVYNPQHPFDKRRLACLFPHLRPFTKCRLCTLNKYVKKYLFSVQKNALPVVVTFKIYHPGL